MIVETIVWIIFTIFLVGISTVKEKYFLRNKKFRNAMAKLDALKAKPSLNKSLADKMSYVRQKTDTGKDFITIVITSLIFLMGFVTVVYNHIPDIYVGLGVAFIFPLIFSYIFAKLLFKGYIYEYKFIDTFIGFMYATTFLVYVKFIDNMYALLLMLLSLLVMYLSSKMFEKLFKEV